MVGSQKTVRRSTVPGHGQFEQEKKSRPIAVEPSLIFVDGLFLPSQRFCTDGVRNSAMIVDAGGCAIREGPSRYRYSCAHAVIAEMLKGTSSAESTLNR